MHIRTTEGQVRVIAQRALPLVQVLLSATYHFMAYHLIRPIHMVKHDSRWCNLHTFSCVRFSPVSACSHCASGSRFTPWTLLRFGRVQDDARLALPVWQAGIPAWNAEGTSRFSGTIGSDEISMEGKVYEVNSILVWRYSTGTFNR